MKSLSRIKRLAAAALPAGLPLMLAFLTACQTTGSGGGSATAPSRPTTPVVEQPFPPMVPAQLATAMKQRFIIAVKASVTERDAVGAADLMRQEIQGNLADARYKVVERAADPFVTVSISTSFDEFSKMGNFYLFEAAGVVKVTRATDNKIVGNQRLAVKGKRELGRDRAVADAARKLAAAVAEFVVARCEPVALGLQSLVLTVDAREFGDSSNPRAEIQAVIREFQKVDGIQSIVLLSDTSAGKVYRFRIIYYGDKFPAGIAFGDVATSVRPSEGAKREIAQTPDNQRTFGFYVGLAFKVALKML